jgi:outer membrane protein assembly factor BamB
MGRWGRGGAAVALAAMVLALPAVGSATTRARVGAGDSKLLVQHGLIYASPKDDEQRVSYYALEQRGGTTRIVANVRVRCRKGMVGFGEIVGTVKGDGAVHIDGVVRSQDGDDTFTLGTATFDGKVATDGSATGRVSYHLIKTDQMNDDDVRDRCNQDDVEWRVSAGTPDAGVARLTAVVPIARNVLDDVTLDGVAAGDGALYVAHTSGSLRRIDASTGKVVWRSEVNAARSEGSVIVGGGAVWLTNASRGNKIARIDPASGKVTARIPGSSIAFAPDGTAWVVTEEFGHELRRVDPVSGETIARFPFELRLTVGLAAGPAGIYVGTETQENGGVVARIDPATGATLATASVGQGDGALRADASGVWYEDPTGVWNLDPTTLAELGSSEDYAAYGTAQTPSGLAVGDYSGLILLGPGATKRFEIPLLSGPLAADGNVVLVLFSLEGQAGLARIDAS